MEAALRTVVEVLEGKEVRTSNTEMSVALTE